MGARGGRPAAPHVRPARSAPRPRRRRARPAIRVRHSRPSSKDTPIQSTTSRHAFGSTMWTSSPSGTGRWRRSALGAKTTDPKGARQRRTCRRGAWPRRTTRGGGSSGRAGTLRRRRPTGGGGRGGCSCELRCTIPYSCSTSSQMRKGRRRVWWRPCGLFWRGWGSRSKHSVRRRLGRRPRFGLARDNRPMHSEPRSPVSTTSTYETQCAPRHPSCSAPVGPCPPPARSVAASWQVASRPQAGTGVAAPSAVASSLLARSSPFSWMPRPPFPKEASPSRSSARRWCRAQRRRRRERQGPHPSPGTHSAPPALLDPPFPQSVQMPWQVYVGFLAPASVFAVGASEFVKRILIQQRCNRCAGTGLVPAVAGAAEVPAPEVGVDGRLVKCPECGGFFPWGGDGWREFWFPPTNRVGNGGPLRQPRGQTSVLYRVPPQSSGARGGDDNYGDG